MCRREMRENLKDTPNLQVPSTLGRRFKEDI